MLAETDKSSAPAGRAVGMHHRGGACRETCPPACHNAWVPARDCPDQPGRWATREVGRRGRAVVLKLSGWSEARRPQGPQGGSHRDRPCGMHRLQWPASKQPTPTDGVAAPARNGDGRPVLRQRQRQRCELAHCLVSRRPSLLSGLVAAASRLGEGLASNGLASRCRHRSVQDGRFTRHLEALGRRHMKMQHGLFQILRLQVRLPLSHHCGPKTRSPLRPPHNSNPPCCLSGIWLAIDCGLVRMHDTIPTQRRGAPPSAMRSSHPASPCGGKDR